MTLIRVKTVVGVFTLGSTGALEDFTPFMNEVEAMNVLLSPSDEEDEAFDHYHIFWNNQKDILDSAGVGDKTYREARRLLAIKVSKGLLETSISEDEAIIEAIKTLGDVNRSLNLLSSRFMSMASAHGVKVSPVDDSFDYDEVLRVVESLPTHPVEKFSEVIGDLVEYRDSLEIDIETMMGELAPNLSGLVGPLLGAKLISIAGGLDDLSRMPGSRIQVLGAERAMFRHLRQKGQPPKHGIIFQHPTISRSPWWQRGKIARSLAAKLSLAARFDVYGKEDRSASLKAGFMKRYQQIKTDFADEPKRMRIIRSPKTKKFKKGKKSQWGRK